MLFRIGTTNYFEGITRCIARGANRIAIVPVLLLTAHHVNKDIPLEIEAAKVQYPNIKFSYGEAMGIHSKIIDSLYDRILEQEIVIDPQATVLLVGRGSSDQAVKRDLTEIGRRLSKKYGINQVNVCFLYGSQPHFDEAIQQLQASIVNQVFIIPYLLFSGILMSQITNKINEQSVETQKFILCENLGYHQNIKKVLKERVEQTIAQI